MTKYREKTMASNNIRTKLWWKYILPGILAAALPLPLVSAQGTAGDSWGGKTIAVGSGDVGALPGMGAGMLEGSPTAQTLGIEDIFIKGATAGNNDALIGYFYNEIAGIPGGGTLPFTGWAQTQTIRVESSNGFAIGAGFYNTLLRAVIEGTSPSAQGRFTSAGITAISTAVAPDNNDGAYGFIAGQIGEFGLVAINSVTTESTGQSVAVELSDILAGGTLTMRGNSVVGANRADPADPESPVVGVGGRAYGVFLRRDLTEGDGNMAGTINLGTLTTRTSGATAAVAADKQSQAVRIEGILSGKLSADGLNAYNTKDDIEAEAYGLWINRMAKPGLLPEEPSPSVNVTNIVAEGTGFAAGARFDYMTDGTVQIGTITVRDGGIAGAGVSGFEVGNLAMGGSVDIGTIDAVGTEYAAGVDLQHGMAVESSLTVGNVTVTANDTADAVLVQGDATKVTAGNLTAIANQSAAGVNIGGNVESLTLRGNIAATGSDQVYGVNVGGTANILLGNSINISAGGGAENFGIKTDGALTLDVAGHALTIDSMFIDGNFTATGNGGSVTVDALAVDGNLSLTGGENGFTFEVDFRNDGTEIAVGAHEARGNLTIIANGEFANAGGLLMFAPGGIDDTVELIGGNPFTDVDWIYDIDGSRMGIQSIGLRSDALINDGYLAAATIHNRYALWNAVRDRTISGNTHLGGGSSSGGIFRGALADPCEAASFCGPCSGVGCGSCKPRKETLGQSLTRTAETVTRAVGRTAAFIIGDRGNVWVNHIGRSDRYESWLNGTDWRTSMEGVQMGVEFLRTRQSQLGMVFGVERGNSYNWNQAGTSADRIKADDTYMGLYGVRVFRNGMDIRGVSGYGEQKYNMTRFGGNAANVSSFTGRTFDTNIDVGKRYTYGRWSARPMVGVDYSSNKLRGVSEIGGNQAVTYSQVTFEQAFVRFGSDFYFQGKDYALRSGISYGYDFIDDKLYADLSTNTIEMGQGLGVIGTDIGQGLLMVNFGADVDITHTTSVFVGYDGQFRSSFRSSGTQKDMHIGYVGLNIKW